MPPSHLLPPNPDMLAVAIEDLGRDFDKIDDHHALEAATKDRREQFVDAAGNHPKAAALDELLRTGKTSRALELAGEILRELRPSVEEVATTPAP